MAWVPACKDREARAGRRVMTAQQDILRGPWAEVIVSLSMSGDLNDFEGEAEESLSA